MGTNRPLRAQGVRQCTCVTDYDAASMRMSTSAFLCLCSDFALARCVQKSLCQGETGAVSGCCLQCDEVQDWL